MSRHISEITSAELDALSREAAEEAVADALAKGIAVTGYMRAEDGSVWLARRQPSGEIEWLERAFSARDGDSKKNFITKIVG